VPAAQIFPGYLAAAVSAFFTRRPRKKKRI
jgi:hypothetical protein